MPLDIKSSLHDTLQNLLGASRSSKDLARIIVAQIARDWHHAIAMQATPKQESELQNHC